MTTFHWTNPVNGNFANGANWNPAGGPPGAADDAVIDAVGTYTVTSSANETVTDVQTVSGATLDITGGLFDMTNGTGAGSNAGTVRVDSGATLEIATTFTNGGTLSLNSTGKADPATLLLSGAVTLNGSGTVKLSDVGLADALGNPVGNIIDGTAPGTTLTNVNNTILGAGQIGLGDGQLTLVNEENGTINANGIHALVIDTSNVQNNAGPGSITNGGLIEATGGTKTHAVNVLTIQNANVFNSFFDPSVGGGTTFWGTIAAASPGAAASGPAGPLGILTLLNTAVFNGAADQGLVEAINHGELDLNKATISGGTLHSDVGATIKTIAGSTNVLTNVFVTNFGTLDVTTGSKLIYQSSGGAVAAATSSGIGIASGIDNTGTINLGAAAHIEFEGSTTLFGSGNVNMGAGSTIFGNGTNVSLFNQNDTISGTGDIGEGQLRLENNGTIDANAASKLVIDTGANAVTNDSSGVLEASGKGGLLIESGVVNSNTSGNGIWATNKSKVDIRGSVGGGGNTTIDIGSTVEFGGLSNDAVRFTDSGATTGTLQLDYSTAINFQGNITGFRGTSQTDTTLSDVLDFRNIANKTATVTWTQGSGQGVLQVTDGKHTADVTLIGTYATADFGHVADAKGGTMVLTSNNTNIFI